MKSVACLIWGIQLFSIAEAIANPSGPNIVSGSVEITNVSGQEMHVSASDGAVIHWKDFSIANGEATHFIQPSQKAYVYNKVIEQSPSYISGLLQANGHVVLINPHGVVISKEGVVNTSGFIGSTLDFTLEDFLGDQSFVMKTLTDASILNLGEIKALNGDLFLLAAKISNEGTLEAPAGKVELAAANELLFRPKEDKAFIVVPAASLQKKDASLSNSGSISGVEVHLKANGNPYSLAINEFGLIEAQGVENRNGVIYLVSETGAIEERGALIARNHDDTGGTALILGKDVRLLENASIDASGREQGGEVYIGGGFQGKEPDLFRSTTTVMGDQATISADATELGDGGKVILWSDVATAFFGKISAKGGPDGGNGGIAEVSGKRGLTFRGLADLSAPKGEFGTLYLDPTDVTITAAATTLGVTIGFPTTLPLITPVNINNTDIVTQLNLFSNVSILTASALGAAGDITVTAPVSWNSANSLTLTADNNILVQADLFNNSALGGAVTLTAINGDITIDALTPNAGVVVGTTNAPITVSAPLGNVSVIAGTLQDSWAVIGAHGNTVLNPTGTTTGDIFVECGDTLLIQGNGSAGNTNCYANIGRLGLDSTFTLVGTPTGDITVNVGNRCNIHGGNGDIWASAWIGHGGFGSNGGVMTGNINLNVGHILELFSGLRSGTAIGNNTSGSSAVGDIRINVGDCLYMHDTPTSITFGGATIGGSTTNGGWRQNIFINVGRNMTMDARNDGFVTLQPFNNFGDFITEGFMNVHVGGDLVMIAGSAGSSQCYMLLHQPQFTTEVWTGGNIRCFNGTAQDAAFPVPFAFNFFGDLGRVDIRAAGNIVMGGGNRFFTTFYNSFTQPINIQADAPFAAGQLWPAQTVLVGGTNIFAGTPLAAASAPIASNGLGGFTLDTAQYNMDVVLFPSGDCGVPFSVATPLPPTAPVIPAASSITYFSSGSTLTLLSADRYSDGTPCDLGIGPFPNQVNLFSFDDLTVGNFRNITIDGNPSAFGVGDVLIIANNDMFMNPFSSVFGAGEVNLVVDNQGPVPPLIGGVWSAGGAFFMDPTASITSGPGQPLRIFTARQPLNSILGTLNGVSFAAGPIFINSNTERWCIWFFDPFFVADYCIFYKDCLIPNVTQAAILADEFLVYLHGYDEYLGWHEDFQEMYDRSKPQSKRKWLAENVITSFDTVPDEKYFIRRRNLRLNNPKSYNAN